MASNYQIQQAMLEAVGRALGDELQQEIAFVGGCTTALMITDEFTRDAVRATDDVDIILHVLGIGDWYTRLEALKAKGFRQVPEDDVICRLRLAVNGQDIIVDLYRMMNPFSDLPIAGMPMRCVMPFITSWKVSSPFA